MTGFNTIKAIDRMSRTLAGGSTGLPDKSGTYEVRYAHPTPTELESVG